MGVTSIQWTDRSVNPIRARNIETGALGHFCVKVSPGCTNCYASKWNTRVRPSGGKLIGTGLAFDARNREKVAFFLDLTKLQEVRSRRIATKWFWEDMSDLFGDWVLRDWLDMCFATMALTPWHTHQVLTKRADRMLEYASDPETPARVAAIARALGKLQWPLDGQPQWVRGGAPMPWPLPNVWKGVSVEDRDRLYRIDELKDAPAAVRFVSFEPLLEDLGAVILDRIHWAILGLESGGHARAGDIEWLHALVDQCDAQGVACFMKQFGDVPMMREPEWRERIERTGLAHVLNHCNVKRVPPGFVPLKFYAKKAGDPAEWPEWARRREFPEVSIGNL